MQANIGELNLRNIRESGQWKDRGEAEHEPCGCIDKELEELLGEGGTSDGDA